MATEVSMRSTALTTLSPLSAAGQMNVQASKLRPDMALLDRMGYHGPLYNSLKHNSRRDALLQAQREGEINKFRAALRGAQLHIGLEDPMVLSMRNILKEADWGVRTCKKCPVAKLSRVLTRMDKLDLGPQLWDQVDLRTARIKFAAWKASLLQDESEETRKAAVDSLGALGLAASQHAPELADCFADISYDVRQAGIQALRQMHEAGAAAAASQLKDTRMGSKTPVRKTACEALGQMDSSLASLHAGSLAILLGDAEADVRKAACLTFVTFGAAGALYAKDVAPLLADADAGTRRAACQALGGMGPAAISAFAGSLSVCLRDADVDVQHAAEHALRCLDVAKLLAEEALKGSSAEEAELTS